MLRPKYKRRIKDLPISKRPREKLLSDGRENLKDAELLAILIGTGVPKQNAIILGEKLLRRFPLGKLDQATIKEIAQIHGIGKSKSARIAAAIELGSRIFSSSLTKVVIKSSDDALTQVRNIADKKQEYLIMLYLNARHELIHKEVVGVGVLNVTRIEPKEIFRPAISSPCSAIIAIHNHPSGDPTPSENDISFTKSLQKAGEIMGIPLVDHLIVCNASYFSFSKNSVGK